MTHLFSPLQLISTLTVAPETMTVGGLKIGDSQISITVPAGTGSLGYIVTINALFG